MWEEGSVTPILHIGWAKPLVSTIGKFDFEIRSQVIIETAEDDEAIPTTTCDASTLMETTKGAGAKLESKSEGGVDKEATEGPAFNTDAAEPHLPIRPVVKLFSQKMKGLRNLLLAEKLNTQAILLQVTAQSQVGGGKKSGRGSNVSDTIGHTAAGEKTCLSGASATGIGTSRESPNNNQNGSNNSAMGASCNSGTLSTEGGSVGRPKRPRRD